MSGFFALDQLTARTTLADWRPLNPPHRVAKTREETTMGVRNDIRSAIAATPGITFAQLRDRFGDNTSTHLAQMRKEGWITRTGSGETSTFALVADRKQAGARGSKPRTATAAKSAKPKSAAAPSRTIRHAPAAKPHAQNTATPARPTPTAIVAHALTGRDHHQLLRRALADLIARRKAIDHAIDAIAALLTA